MCNYGIAALLAVFMCCLLWSQADACSSGQCQLLEACSSEADCASGLYCSSCPIAGDLDLRCTRSSPYNVLAQNNSLPFNKYAWLTTHNSFSIVGEPSLTGVPRATFLNQEDSVTSQLKNGVRGLMLDMYDFKSDIWLCHSFGGECYDFTAFEPALNTLQEIEAFLSANPSEIVTIIIEDYVQTPNGLTNLFTAAGLMKYWFPVSAMPKEGGDWPLVNDMIAKNQRLLVFTSMASKESTEGIAYEWNYLVENQYGDGGMKAGSCPTRSQQSWPLDSTSRSLVLQNFFPTDAVEEDACHNNSDVLSQMLRVCYAAAGQRWANFLAVDFYKRSQGGGASQAVDALNGKMMCGCDDIHACQPGATSGACTT